MNKKEYIEPEILNKNSENNFKEFKSKTENSASQLKSMILMRGILSLILPILFFIIIIGLIITFIFWILPFIIALAVTIFIVLFFINLGLKISRLFKK